MRTPTLPPRTGTTPRQRQRGAAIVEFAFVALLFFMLLLGVMEFGRWMYTLNAATEATRWGARLAAVCSQNDPIIKTRMRVMFNVNPATQISIQYAPPGCTVGTCQTVEVSLTNVTFTPLIPFLGVPVPLPGFSTSLPRELMNSAGNPVCQ